MSMIEIKNLKKSFDNLEVLKSIDFHVDKGEVITLIGASGSGKSSCSDVSTFWRFLTAEKS